MQLNRTLLRCSPGFVPLTNLLKWDNNGNTYQDVKLIGHLMSELCEGIDMWNKEEFIDQQMFMAYSRRNNEALFEEMSSKP